MIFVLVADMALVVVHVEAVANLYCAVYVLAPGAAAQLNVAEFVVILVVFNEVGGVEDEPLAKHDAASTLLRIRFPGSGPKPLLKLIPTLIIWQ